MKRLVAVLASALLLSGCSLGAPPPADINGSGVFDLGVGDCFNGAALQGEVTSIPVIDCASKHDFEVYAASHMDAAAYPGEQRTAGEADATCTSAFEDFLGETFEAAHAARAYDFTSLYPTAGSWDLGDRQVLCAITKTDADGKATKTTGSLRGSVSG